MSKHKQDQEGITQIRRGQGTAAFTPTRAIPHAALAGEDLKALTGAVGKNVPC